MSKIFAYLVLALVLSFSQSLPQFVYDGVESFHDCSKEKEQISFSIYGTFNEKVYLEKMKVDKYFIDDMGDFECSLQEVENPKIKERKYKILCAIEGEFERKGYILEKPKVHGFEILKWPKTAEKKTFLIGKCGKRIELDTEPLLFTGDAAFSNPLETVRKGIVDKALSSLPQRHTLSEANMCSAMKSAQQSFSLSEAESAYLIYKWIGTNINYDCYGLNHGGIDYSEKGTYNKGEGVCAGYAAIYETMGNYLGLETAYVVGYSKGAGFVPGRIPSRSDHAWNSVKIGSSYYLVDITWGAGSCDGDTYKKNFRDFYFCTNPEAFIRTHLPEEKKWQLISNTITLEEFVTMLKLNDAFYEQGFTGISPDTASFSSSGTAKVVLTYDKSITNLALLNNLYLLQGNTYMGQNNGCFYTKEDGRAEVTCFTNYKGQYMLRIFGGAGGSQSYPELVEFTIQSTQDASVPMSFPTIYDLFSNSDTQLIEPLYNPLTKGTMVNFKFTSTTYDNLYIVMENNHYFELDRGPNGEFIGESVFIHGSQVSIATLNNNYFQYLLQYTTVNDPNNPEEPTFPQSFPGPKNVLYSPLAANLKYGKSYTFSIKCESCNEVKVLDGNSFIGLDRNGSIFSGTITIKGTNGKVSIINMNSSTSYLILYTYYITG